MVVIQSGRAHDRFLQACRRELVLLEARWECLVKAEHIVGDDNRLPDLLSRWHLHPRFENELRSRTKSCHMEESFVSE